MKKQGNLTNFTLEGTAPWSVRDEIKNPLWRWWIGSTKPNSANNDMPRDFLPEEKVVLFMDEVQSFLPELMVDRIPGNTGSLSIPFNAFKDLEVVEKIFEKHFDNFLEKYLMVA